MNKQKNTLELNQELTIRQKITKTLTAPFKSQAQKDMEGLHALNPNAEEVKMIKDSVQQKYAPVLRNSTLGAILAAPGILLVKEPMVIQMILSVIITTTGVAWFSMSLKDVKLKFAEFGMELTSNMMEAFLTSLYLAFLYAGYSIMSPEIQNALAWGKEQGIDLAGGVKNTPGVEVGAKVLSIIIGVRMILSNVRQAVVKFDANDALLTGAGAVAVEAFQKQLDKVREAGTGLDRTQDLKSANLKIIMGLGTVFKVLQDINPSLISETFEAGSNDVAQEVNTFDKKFAPHFLVILNFFHEFEVSFDLKQRIELLKGSLETLQEKKSSDQAFGDTVYSELFILISDLIKEHQDDLSNLSIAKTTEI
jgi:hypothetical protein